MLYATDGVLGPRARLFAAFRLVCRARPESPEEGYTAFFVEMTFENPDFGLPFVFTTGVNILPDTYLSR